MMRIIPLRDMLLSGKPVEHGVAVSVSDVDGGLALRHGWAAEAPATKASKSKDAPTAESEKTDAD